MPQRGVCTVCWVCIVCCCVYCCVYCVLGVCVGCWVCILCVGCVGFHFGGTFTEERLFGAWQPPAPREALALKRRHQNKPKLTHTFAESLEQHGGISPAPTHQHERGKTQPFPETSPRTCAAKIQRKAFYLQ